MLSNITINNHKLSLVILARQLSNFVKLYPPIPLATRTILYIYIYMGLEDTFTDTALATPTKQPTILFTLPDLPLN